MHLCLSHPNQVFICMSVLQRSFKIRKSSKKVREEEAEEDRREVHNLNDLHLTNKVSREDSSNRS